MPVVDGVFLQPWNVPGYAERQAAKTDNRGKKAKRKPAIPSEVLAEQPTAPRRGRPPKASNTLKDVLAKAGPEDLSHLGLDDG